MKSEETLYRATSFVWYVFYIVEALLALRFILKFLGANPGAPFTQLVYNTSQVFVSPFQYVFGTPAVAGSVVELSTLLAMIVYWLVAWGIVKLIVMNRDVDQRDVRYSLEQQDKA